MFASVILTRWIPPFLLLVPKVAQEYCAVIPSSSGDKNRVRPEHNLSSTPRHWQWPKGVRGKIFFSAEFVTSIHQQPIRIYNHQQARNRRKIILRTYYDRDHNHRIFKSIMLEVELLPVFPITPSVHCIDWNHLLFLFSLKAMYID